MKKKSLKSIIMTNKNNPEIGKFILDSLSVGMYNNPLMLFREYVQNSVDAIDNVKEKKYSPLIKIDIDGFERIIEIFDNGSGLPSRLAKKTLLNLGKSTKNINYNRGFRGIGRLGGIGYCDTIQFITKYRNESFYTITSWNCKKLTELLNNKNHEMNAIEVIAKITEFKKKKYSKNLEDHFFKVKMINVHSSYDMILDIPKVKAYVSQVCPVSFNFNEFQFAKQIEKDILKKINMYKTYKIVLNEEIIFKPYSSNILVGSDKRDKICGFEKIILENGNYPLAIGWIAKTNLLGAINENTGVTGLRVRCGNIMIGDNNLLLDFFREERFHKYLIGEIHINNKNLIPNARRDDFEDNFFKEEFYTEIINKIGLPYSKKIRKASQERSKQNQHNKADNILDNAYKIIRNGYLSEKHKNESIRKLETLKNNSKIKVETINKTIDKLKLADSFINKNYKNTHNKEYLKKIIEIIYDNNHNEMDTKRIINKIISIMK